LQKLSPNSSDKIASVTVIIVNWNCGAVLSKCLYHLLNQTVPPARVLVMNNGSSNDSLHSIPQKNQIDIQLLGTNLGFVGANNRALALCDTDYIALPNPDAFPNPDWVERLLAAADSYPDVAAFASLQLRDDSPEFVDGAGDSYHISGQVWCDQYGARLASIKLINKVIFSPCAAAALYRRQALFEAGGFDEDFFCYIEDVDLGFRLRLTGHQSLLVHNAIVSDVGSAATGGQHSDFSVYHGHRNVVWGCVEMNKTLNMFTLKMTHSDLPAIYNNSQAMGNQFDCEVF
jgi:GT2 family glycosyltransferase